MEKNKKIAYLLMSLILNLAVLACIITPIVCIFVQQVENKPIIQDSEEFVFATPVGITSAIHVLSDYSPILRVVWMA